MAPRKLRSSTTGRATAIVHRDAEWREYRVRLKVDGEPRPDADYHTDCRRDADATARSIVEFASEWTDPVTNRSNTMTNGATKFCLGVNGF